VLERPERKKLPPIVPVLLQQPDGRSEPVVTVFEELIEAPAEMLTLLRPYVPSFETLVDDVGRLSSEEIRSRELTAQVQVMIFLLKRGRVSPSLLEDLEDWREELLAAGVDALGLGPVVSYILRIRQEPTEAIQSFFEKLGPLGEEAFVTAAQQLKEQGKAEGRAEGRAEGQAGLLVKQLRIRFGSVPEATVDRVHRATAAEVELWAERVLTAESLEDVFAAH
jgi:hypothetical protein